MRIKISYKERQITIQLDFDPNFTTDLLINSLLELLKIQGNTIYLVTFENEILMPNIKIIDLILLNPKKYKNLKLLSSYEDYYTNDTTATFSKVNYNKYENYDYNFSNKPEPVDEGSTRENYRPSYNYDKKEGLTQNNITNNSALITPHNQNNSNHSNPTPCTEEKDMSNYKFLNYNKSRETDDLLLSMNSNEDFSSFDKLDKAKEEKSNTNIGQGQHNPTNNMSNNMTSFPTYKSYLNDTKYSANINNLPKYPEEENLSKYEKHEKKPSYTYKERLAYLESKDNSRSKDNTGIEDYNFDKNILNHKVNSQELDIGRNNTIGNKESSTPTTEISNKYNYSERLKEDLNRQRYMTEKRTFRNNQYMAGGNLKFKLDNKTDDDSEYSSKKNEFKDYKDLKDISSKDKFEKFSDKFTARYALLNPDTQSYNDDDLRRDGLHTPDHPDNKKNYLKKGLTSLNQNLNVNNIIQNGKGEGLYKITSSRENVLQFFTYRLRVIRIMRKRTQRKQEPHHLMLDLKTNIFYYILYYFKGKDLLRYFLYTSLLW